MADIFRVSPPQGRNTYDMSTQAKPIEGGPEPSENLSYEQFIALRSASQEEPETPEETEETTEETEEVEELEESSQETETEDAEETEEEASEEEETETAPIDLESLSAEEIQSLARKARSRLLKDLGRFKGEAKVLRQELEALKEQTAKPLPPAVPQAEIPEVFRNLKSMEEIAAKHAEMEKVAEDADRLLDESEGYGPDEEFEFGGATFTRNNVKAAKRTALAAITKYLPAMHREVVVSEQRKNLKAQFEERIPKELPEVANKESESGKLYHAMIADPLVARIRETVPDIDPQLDYLLAHAARSISAGAKLVQPKVVTGKAPQAKVPESPAGSAAARTGIKTASKAAEAAKAQWEKTGSTEDWQAWKTLSRQS